MSDDILSSGLLGNLVHCDGNCLDVERFPGMG